MSGADKAAGPSQVAGHFDVAGEALAGSGPFIIAGPCVIEDLETCLQVADHLAGLERKLGLRIIFKSSFDKANRTSLDSYRGPGLEKGLTILDKVRRTSGLPVLSDIHLPEQAKAAAEVLDVIQIPAFLCRQTDLLVAAGRTGKPVNIKKAQFMAPEDMTPVVDKLKSAGGKQIMLTERGTFFGYRNLVVDIRSLVVMAELGHPVIFDATHSVQRPGGRSTCSGGDPGFIAPLARAAVAAGVDGVFMEVHPDPARAKCDGANSLELARTEEVLSALVRISGVLR